MVKLNFQVLYSGPTMVHTLIVLYIYINNKVEIRVSLSYHSTIFTVL